MAMNHHYYCHRCSEFGNDYERFNHDCGDNFILFIPVKKKNGRIKAWFLSLDHMFLLMLLACTVLNSIFLLHHSLGWCESIIESFCVGMIVTGIFKK